MKLVSVTCPHCGGTLQVTPNSKMVTCDYCNSDFMIDDEIRRVRLDDAEQAGYEFEKGRQRAILEAEQASVKAMCPNCMGTVIVDNRNQYSTCPYCNQVFDVAEAIALYNKPIIRTPEEIRSPMPEDSEPGCLGCLGTIIKFALIAFAFSTFCGHG